MAIPGKKAFLLIVMVWFIGVMLYPPLIQAGSPAYLEPPDGYVYHGTSPDKNDINAYIAALNYPTLTPAVLGMHASIPGTRPQALINATKEFLNLADSIGAIPHLSYAFSIGDGQPIDDVIAYNDTYDRLISELGEVIKEYGRPVFVRLGFEFNGPWNGYHPGTYPKAFRKVVDLFREAGAYNFAAVWCYEPNGPDDFDSVDLNGEPLWYPGDEYVDWFGLDLFRRNDFTLQADSRSGNQSYFRTLRFLEMAKEHGKPVFLSELATVDIHIISEDENSGYPEGKEAWERWFEPFFSLLNDHPQIKGFNYMSQDYRGSKYEKLGWRNARLQDNAYIFNHWISQLKSDRFIHATTVQDQNVLINTRSKEEDEVIKLVESFGESLKMVSLLAPVDQVAESIESNYKDYVTIELLREWQAMVEQAPGRLVSSPWPESIQVLRIDKVDDQQYVVYGYIIEVTALDLATGSYTEKKPVTLIVQKTEGSWLITSLKMEEDSE
jgi:hypothetical protein